MKETTIDQLRQMEGSEGLIIQGCGGDLQEWVDGINDLLTKAGILLNGSRFQAENVAVFHFDGLTNLCFPFEGVELRMGQLSMWRLQTHEQFGGTWLSDYVPNRLGGFLPAEQEQQKPDCELIGRDGNIFNLIGIASRTLRQNGLQEQAEEMRSRIMDGDCPSYGAALGIIGEYVNITGPSEAEENMGMGGMS